MNEKYLICVKDLMLPKPRKRNHKISILVTSDEFLPVIDGDTGEVIFI